jgi:hypothetical protein
MDGRKLNIKKTKVLTQTLGKLGNINRSVCRTVTNLLVSFLYAFHSFSSPLYLNIKLWRFDKKWFYD